MLSSLYNHPISNKHEWNNSVLQVLVIINYSLSLKTVNTRENFWNVYCSVTNQMQDETPKDNRQTTAWISHDLIRNNALAFSSKELAVLPRLIFKHQTTKFGIDLEASVNCQIFT